MDQLRSTQSNPLGACTGIYSDLYWYHPNYLEDGASQGLVDLVCEHPGRRPVDLVTDLYGTVHQGFLYTPWGENMHEHHATTSGFNSPFRFNAKELDETGLAYYGARYYQNRYSLWLSVDPLAHEFLHLTGYNFTENNPISLIDPDGMQAKPPLEGDFEIGHLHIDADGAWILNKDKKWEPLGDTPWEENNSLQIVEVGAEKTDHQRAMENPLVRHIHGATGNAAEVIMELAMWAAPVPKIGPALKLFRNVPIFRAAKGVPKYLYHYTSREAAQSISQSGLRVGRDGFSYLTNTKSLSPLQAQIELALPANRALPNSLLRINTSGLSPAAIRRVQGNLPGLGAGGGTEFLFNQTIPSSAIKIIR